MLKSEQAREELNKVRVEAWQTSRLDSLKKLPAHLRKVARPLVGVDDDGKDYEYQQHSKLREEIRPLAANMTKEQRIALFETLLPGLGKAVEDGWQLLARLPHQLDVEAKSFRFPSNEALLLKQRLHWVEGLLNEIGPFPDKDLAWHAAWAGHHWDSECLSTLLAGAIDAGGKSGDEIFEILCASARGEHEIGIMGRHVVQSLLCASRPDGWGFIEKLLLAAQREEGLRQTILETVDSAHPEAFRRILRVILDNNLVRFSATVRALDVWVGYMWDSVSTGVANRVIEKLLLYLEDADARSKALKGKDPEQVYLALWAIAFDDANAALKPAGELLRHAKAEFRFVAARVLAQIPLPESQQMLLSVLHDKDLHLTYCALQPFEYGELDEKVANSNLFEHLEMLLTSLPEKPLKLKPLVWPWTNYTFGRELVSEIMIRALGNRPATRFINHLPKLTNYERAAAITELGKPDKVGSEARDAFLDWVGDKTGQVRDAALAGLAKCEVTAADAPRLESLLTRTASDLRRGILGLLLKLPDADALASADRLIAAGAAPQRLAGLELLRQLTDSNRCLAEARERAAAYRKSHPKLAAAERQQIENIENARAEKLTLNDALGLLNSEQRTWPAKPVNRKAVLHSPAAIRLLSALDELVHQHRETKITVEDWNDQPIEEPLSEAHYCFPAPKSELSIQDDRARLPLAEIWEKFWAERPKDLRDGDGFEALRAWAWKNNNCSDVFRKRCKPAVLAILGDYKKIDIRYDGVVSTLLRWFMRLYPPAGGPDFVLDATDTVYALIPETELRYLKKEDDYDDEDWRGSYSPFDSWDSLACWQKDDAAELWTAQHSIRLYHLSRWYDQPFGKTGNTSKDGRPIPRQRPVTEVLLAAHSAGGATDADVIEQLLGPRDVTEYGLSSFDDLKFLSSRDGEKLLKKYPAAVPLFERCRARVIEVELTRGDTPTPASRAALDLERVYGISNLVAFLRALGDRGFVRDLYGAKDNKQGVFSKLIKSCFPSISAEGKGGAVLPLPKGEGRGEGEGDVRKSTAHDSLEDFKKQVIAAQIPEQRLVELALYAPHWAEHAQFALSWEGLLEAVWWTHAHTRGADLDTSDDEEDDARWKADISRHTALTPGELRDGAVDVAWFQRIHKMLGDKRWEMVSESAKYASNAGGHTRARLFADAMLGRVKKAELLKRMMAKRYQDAVRALGLLPLAEGKSREGDLLDRYKAIQEFIRSGRQFGSQRQASEKRAAQIGQENLARTAGYPDPIRLQWAMEARAVADLADGPINVTVDGVTVSLGIDVWGEVELNVTKDGKTLSDIPPKLKKDKKIAALRERKTELKRQASRIRVALETFMCRGEHVTGAELQELMKHPLLAPMLSGLVLVGEGVMGYPINDGKVLQDHSGNKEALKKDEKVRIAHPIDLLPASKWHAWQTDCFAKERIQPFKQVFRELYTITKPEKDEGTQSRRYAGHQVQPRKAMALLGARGWVHHPEEGVRKTYHDANIIVWLEFDQSFYTPAEIEGLTLESVHFTKRGDGKPVKLTEIDPRLFSETMRDLDLVVSVAHRGGVDPEATASTLEMRASLVRETAALLKLPNIRIKDNHVYIKGELGEYSVHLGSAIARRIPGDMLFIVAVHSQHRGRIFLPFADNDPRTAEVMSKVLLLARDKEIKDPSIIEQIRR